MTPHLQAGLVTSAHAPILKYPKPQEGGKTQKRTLKKTIVASIVVLMVCMGISEVIMATGGTPGHIWLNAYPGQKASGVSGWPSGGYITAHEYGPDAVLTFTLIVENRGKEDLTDLRIAMAIHGPDDPPPETTADDFVSIQIESSIHQLGDFGATEYNPFDESSGGKHHVYVGTDAIWDIYDHNGVIPSGEKEYLDVTVTLGGAPSNDFEIHFDAFDGFLDYKTPNGHDLTFISGARLPPEGKDPPIACIVGGDERTVNEGDEVLFIGCCSRDPDGYIVSYEWDLDIYNDTSGDGDPANDVDATGPQVYFTWYDDYETDVKLTVTDNDGLTDTAYQYVTVLNVDPTVDFEGAFVEFDLSLRVAGEKWHNVELKVVTNYDAESDTWDDEVGVLEVERWPGPPDENPTNPEGGSIPVSIDVSGQDTYTAIVTYDPYADEGDAILDDQDINGQLWGANPVWLIATFPDGTVCKKHHTFNVQQSTEPEGRNSDHWNHVEPWVVPINLGAAVGIPITFVASATDPGSDDLTFEWDWGDATSDANTYLYDVNRGPDPAFPPGSPYEPIGAPWDPSYTTYVGQMPPLFVTDTTYHTYTAAGTFTVTLTVYDDDGGMDTYTLEIDIGSGFGCP